MASTFKRMMNVEQAAEALGLSRFTVYRMCRAGVLPHYRVGAKGAIIRINQTDIDAYLERSKVDAKEPAVSSITGSGSTRSATYVFKHAK